MLPLPLNSVRNVLCLGAHSDDIEIGAGATLLRLIEENPGIAIRWVVFSSNPVREAEARDSAGQFLGSVKQSEVIVRQFRDGFFPYDPAIKEFFEEIKRGGTNPDLVLTHFRTDLHQDHRTLNQLTWNTFRNHLIFEYEIPKYEGDLAQPNVFIPLKENHCKRKLEILSQAFASQADKPWFTPDTFWALLRLRGLESNSPTRLAEAFHCRKMVF